VSVFTLLCKRSISRMFSSWKTETLYLLNISLPASLPSVGTGIYHHVWWPSYINRKQNLAIHFSPPFLCDILHILLTGKTGKEVFKAKAKLFPFPGQGSWPWKEECGTKSRAKQIWLMPLKNSCAERSWKHTVCGQNQAGQRAEGKWGFRRTRSTTGSGMFGCLPIFLSSWSEHKAFLEPLGFQQSLESSLGHRSLSEDTATACAPPAPGWSTIPCFYSCKVLFAS
jgi:hypothetical protein